MNRLLLTLLLAMPSVAFADDAAPSLSEGIVKVPEGSRLTFPDGKVGDVTQFSFLLPEPYYDQALVKAKRLEIVEPAYKACVEDSLYWMEKAKAALASTEEQMDADEALVDKLTIDIQQLESRALTAETKLAQAKVQRNTAWAITGGLVLGAVTVTVVAVAP
jgi:hypothetical protein